MSKEGVFPSFATRVCLQEFKKKNQYELFEFSKANAAEHCNEVM